MDIISIRLDGVDELDFFSKMFKQKRSKFVRDLVDEGKKLKAMNLYKNNKISLGLAAKFAGLSLGEFLDLLEEYNIKLNLTLEDAKSAMKHAEDLL